MNDQTPPIQIKGALGGPDFSPASIRARIVAFCDWFGVEPPKLKVRRGSVYLTDSLTTWMFQNGASCDWIVSGDPKAMATAYRDRYAPKTPLAHLLQRFDDNENRILLDCLKRQNAGEFSIEEAMERFRTLVEEHRSPSLPA